MHLFLMEIHVPQIVHIIAISFPFIKTQIKTTVTRDTIVNVRDFYLLVLKEIYISAFPHSLIALRCFFFYSEGRIWHFKIQLLQIKDI